MEYSLNNFIERMASTGLYAGDINPAGMDPERARRMFASSGETFNSGVLSDKIGYLLKIESAPDDGVIERVIRAIRHECGFLESNLEDMREILEFSSHSFRMSASVQGNSGAREKNLDTYSKERRYYEKLTKRLHGLEAFSDPEFRATVEGVHVRLGASEVRHDVYEKCLELAKYMGMANPEQCALFRPDRSGIHVEILWRAEEIIELFFEDRRVAGGETAPAVPAVQRAEM